MPSDKQSQAYSLQIFYLLQAADNLTARVAICTDIGADRLAEASREARRWIVRALKDPDTLTGVKAPKMAALISQLKE